MAISVNRSAPRSSGMSGMMGSPMGAIMNPMSSKLTHSPAGKIGMDAAAVYTQNPQLAMTAAQNQLGGSPAGGALSAYGSAKGMMPDKNAALTNPNTTQQSAPLGSTPMAGGPMDSGQYQNDQINPQAQMEAMMRRYQYQNQGQGVA